MKVRDSKESRSCRCMSGAWQSNVMFSVICSAIPLPVPPLQTGTQQQLSKTTGNNCPKQLATTGNNCQKQLATTGNNCPKQLATTGKTTGNNWKQLETTGNNWQQLATTVQKIQSGQLPGQLFPLVLDNCCQLLRDVILDS